MPDSAGIPDPPPPRESIGPRPCRRCGYDLEAQRPRDNIITCPECGLTGTWREVLLQEEDEMRWRRLMLAASGPCITLLILAVLILIIGDAAQVGWILNISALVGLAAFIAGFVMPPVASGFMNRGKDARARILNLVGGMAAGWATNFVVTAALTALVSWLA